MVFVVLFPTHIEPACSRQIPTEFWNWFRRNQIFIDIRIQNINEPCRGSISD